MEHNYDLFLEVEDLDLQARNRAVCLYNMFDSNSNNGKVNSRGVKEMLSYMKMIPEGARSAVMAKLHLMIDSPGTA